MTDASFRVGERSLALSDVHVVGILNVTPDSFSDGGRHLDPGRAEERAFQMAGEGAALLDVGGESTRPGSATVPVDEEIRRVVPVLERLARRSFPLPISVDTCKAEVARAALDAGAALVNDVSALGDPGMAPLVAARGVPVVLMHMRGTPRDMQDRAVYGDVVAEVREELARALARALAAGIAADRVLLDPGIGFAKTAPQSVELLARLPELAGLGRPLFVGASRKSFIGALTGAPAAERLPGSLAAVTAAVLGGASFVRVHDVAPSVQCARVAQALREAGASRTNP